MSGAADGLLMGAPATPASRAVWHSRQTWLNGRVPARFRLKGRILWICRPGWESGAAEGATLQRPRPCRPPGCWRRPRPV